MPVSSVNGTSLYHSSREAANRRKVSPLSPGRRAASGALALRAECALPLLALGPAGGGPISASGEGVARRLPAAGRRRIRPTAAATRARGVTLVELVVFIVIAGIIAAALAMTFGGTLRGVEQSKELALAVALAQERMELILGQRRRSDVNFTDFTDPCPTAAQACTGLAGYSVASSIVNNSDECTGTATPDCRTITVTVTAPDGSQAAQVTTHVMNY